MCPELIRYGLLRYYREQVSMSPELLAMTLSMFGEDDITVSNVDDFERLVTLRELALLRIAGVPVRIIYLAKPIDDTIVLMIVMIFICCCRVVCSSVSEAVINH